MIKQTLPAYSHTLYTTKNKKFPDVHQGKPVRKLWNAKCNKNNETAFLRMNVFLNVHLNVFLNAYFIIIIMLTDFNLKSVFSVCINNCKQ